MTIMRVHWALPIVAAVVVAGAGVGLADTGAPPAPPGPLVSVLVRADSVTGATDSVLAAGGTVVASLPIINGVSARVPANAVRRLAKAAKVQAVTADGALTSTDPADAAAQAALTPVDPGTVTPLQAAQASKADPASTGGLTGQGVDVALIDTGIAAVPGLSAAGQVIKAPDFSADPTGSGLDGYGHGTAMAGIIAGRDTGDGTGYAGVAPGARLLNVRVGANDGTVDVSQVIAAIGWVVDHKRDHGLNVRVINLSYGTDSAQPVDLDPLAYAADVAWRNGIVVVAATGNAGNAARVSDPASDPNIIAVGASDTNGTADTSDDTLATFSSAGGTRQPDLLAPGSRVLGLRAPGSFIDTAFPESRRSELYARGSGTSQAAAVVSGEVALLLQQRPHLTPNQVKALLVQSADTVPATTTPVLDLEGALTSRVPAHVQTQKLSGRGSLEASRGSAHVIDGGHLVQGELDAFGSAWSGSAWSGSAWSGSAWSGSAWSGSAWSGSAWSGSAWSGSAWSGSAWSGSAWSGSAWSGSAWSGSAWSGSAWSGSAWSGSVWSGVVWE